MRSQNLPQVAYDLATILMDKQPAFVAEDVLSQALTLPGYAVRWYIFQLRQAGYVIEAALYVAPAAFATGTRGWTLTRIQDTPFNPVGSNDVEGASEPVDLQTDVAALAALIGKNRRAAKRRR